MAVIDPERYHDLNIGNTQGGLWRTPAKLVRLLLSYGYGDTRVIIAQPTRAGLASLSKAICVSRLLLDAPDERDRTEHLLVSAKLNGATFTEPRQVYSASPLSPATTEGEPPHPWVVTLYPDNFSLDALVAAHTRDAESRGRLGEMSASDARQVYQWLTDASAPRG